MRSKGIKEWRVFWNVAGLKNKDRFLEEIR